MPTTDRRAWRLTPSMPPVRGWLLLGAVSVGVSAWARGPAGEPVESAAGTPPVVDTAPTPAAPPEDPTHTGPPRRVIQGLTTSFAGPACPPDPAASEVLAFVEAHTAPKRVSAPPLRVPPEVMAAGIEGEVRLALNVSGAGTVSEVVVVTSLSPQADEACVTMARASLWSPGCADGHAVIVRGVPYTCKFRQVAETAR